MNANYMDILSRVPEEPKWWDENAVPRFEDFSPRMTANIYAREAALIEIHCQGCGQSFQVAMTAGYSEQYENLRKAVEEKTIHFGDPPNIGCCLAGASMNSVPVRVIEFWAMNDHFNWGRIHEFDNQSILPNWLPKPK